MQKTCQVFLYKNGKPIVKSLRQILDYIPIETRGVSKDILSGEHHDRLAAQETTLGKRKAKHIQRI